MFQRASAQDWKAEDHAIRHFGHHLPKSEAILCPDCLFRCKSTYFSDKLLADKYYESHLTTWLGHQDAFNEILFINFQKFC
jgi:hypothetical protein